MHFSWSAVNYIGLTTQVILIAKNQANPTKHLVIIHSFSINRSGCGGGGGGDGCGGHGGSGGCGGSGGDGGDVGGGGRGGDWLGIHPNVTYYSKTCLKRPLKLLTQQSS